METYKHSGKLGDLVYALPAVRALGGGTLCVNVSGDSIGLSGFNAIRPLLEAQSFVSQVRIWEGEAVDVDLDTFRNFDPAQRNLIDCHLLAAGLQPVKVDDPWLTIDRPHKVAGRPVVFGGARNWMPIPGFWETCYARFGREATLVGLPDEHTRFEREVGPIHFTPTANMLEAAEVIAGAELFVGSQSSGYAIAEGLKQNSILGVYPVAPNCTFARPNAFFVTNSRHLRRILRSGLPMGNAHEIQVVRRPLVVSSSPKLGQAGLCGTSVIIVTYQSESEVEPCLRSVLASIGDENEVIVVDNGSTDRTLATVRAVSDRVMLIRNEQNLGYTAAANVGMRASRGRYLALLNPDTVVQPTWLEGLTARFVDSSVGAVGPVSDAVAGIQAVAYHLERSLAGSDFSNIQRELAARHSGESISSPLLMGFCLVLRRDILDQIGLLDEDLWLGNDDLELSLRLRSNGYLLLVARDIFVHHDWGASFNQVPSEWKTARVEESTAALIRKVADAYAPVPPPPSDELWGVPFVSDEEMSQILISTHPDAARKILEDL